MVLEDLIYYGESKTIKILAECGLKYFHSDFMQPNEWNRYKCISQIRFDECKKVRFIVYYSDNKNPNRGKSLKKKREIFYNYYNVKVEKISVVFEYSYKELEIEYLKGEGEESEEVKTEHIMKKIEKLLALQNSPNEHEALSASLMAQKLLAKYNIDIEKIRGETDEAIDETEVFVDTGNKWKYNLANVIADNYRCKVYYLGFEKIVFRGYRTDIIVARRVYAYLFSVGKKLGKEYVKKHKEEYGYTEGIYNSYCKGFINGIKKELEKQCTALELYCPSKVENDWKIFSKKMKGVNTEINLKDIEAYEQGEYDGKNSVYATYLDDSEKYIKE